MTKIFPVEGALVGEQFVRDGTMHAAAEMIRSGTTCYNVRTHHAAMSCCDPSPSC